MTGIRQMISELPAQMQSNLGAYTLLRHLREQHVVTPSATLGSEDSSGRAAMSEEISKSPDSGFEDASNVADSLEAASVTLTDLYRDNRKWADRTLAAGLIAAGACVAVVLSVVVAIVAWNRSAELIEYASSVIPALLSGSLFYLHRFQQRRLDGVQNDIRTLELTEGWLRLARRIDDEQYREAAYGAIMDLLSGQLRPPSAAGK